MRRPSGLDEGTAGGKPSGWRNVTDATGVARGIACAIPLTTLVVSSQVVFPFVVPRVLLFRVVVVLLLAMTAQRWMAWLGQPRSTSPIERGLGLALLVAILSTATAVDPQRSLWSTLERMQGLTGLLAMVALYLGLRTCLTSPGHWTAYWSVMASVGLIHGLAAVLQVSGIVRSLQPDERVAGLFGHPLFYGSFMVVIGVVCAGLALESQGTRTRLLWVSAAAALVAASTLSGSRAVVAALVAVILVGLGAGAAGRSGWGRSRPAAVAILAIVAVIAVRNVRLGGSPIGRTLRLSLAERTWQTRLQLWAVTWEAVRSRPLTGWGAEGFSVAFSAHYRRELGREEAWFDRPHSALAEWSVAAGIPGALAFLALYGVGLHAALRARSRAGRLALSAPLVAHLVVTLVGLSTFETDLLLFSYLAFLSVRAATDGERKPANGLSGRHRLLVTSGVTVVGIAIVFGVLVPTWGEARRLEEVLRVRASTGGVAFAAWGGALDRSGRYRSELRHRFAASVAGWPPGQGRWRVARWAVRELEAEVSAHPRDVKARLLLVALYQELALTPEVRTRLLSQLAAAEAEAPNQDLLHVVAAEALAQLGDWTGVLREVRWLTSDPRFRSDALWGRSARLVASSCSTGAWTIEKACHVEVDRLLDEIPLLPNATIEDVAGAYERSGNAARATEVRNRSLGGGVPR